MNPRIRCSLTGRKRWTSAEHIRGRLTIRNMSDGPLWILTRFTPLDATPSDGFVIRKKNGRKVPYDGALYKLGPLRRADYVLLSPNQSLTADVDLSLSYGVSAPGEYEVIPRFDRWLVWLADANDRHRRAPPISGSGLVTPDCEWRSWRLVVTKGPGRVLTSGQVARREFRALREVQSRFVSARRNRLVGKPLPASFIGGTSEQRHAIQAAHERSYALSRAALERVRDDSHYVTWFGRAQRERTKRVKNTFENMVSRLESESFVYNLRGKICPKSALGYTFKKSNCIWLCGAYWKAPFAGVDSQIGTLVHEHSHCSGLTEDLTYGQAAALALAARAPKLAVRNADNYEYYCAP